MKENIVFENFETNVASLYETERVTIRKKNALFVPNHRYFRNETIEELRKTGHLSYPLAKMPVQPEGYIKGKDDDCL